MHGKLEEMKALEAAATFPVYGQLPFLPDTAVGCEIITAEGRRILDFYGAPTLRCCACCRRLFWNPRTSSLNWLMRCRTSAHLPATPLAKPGPPDETI